MYNPVSYTVSKPVSNLHSVCLIQVIYEQKKFRSRWFSITPFPTSKYAEKSRLSVEKHAMNYEQLHVVDNLVIGLGGLKKKVNLPNIFIYMVFS
jgi:hypothetical protein